MYSVVHDEKLYTIQLPDCLSSLDVCDGKYILIGSSSILLFELKEDRLHRVVVLDEEDDEPFEVK